MKGNVRTDVFGNYHILLYGGLTYDNGLPMRQELQTLLVKRPASIITIDFQHVDFVGSSGINIFVETLKIINREKIRINIRNVGSEFIKVFKLYQLEQMDKVIVVEEEVESNATENLKPPFEKAA